MKQTWGYKITYFTGLFLAFLMFFIVVNPTYRSQARSLLVSPHRMVLSIARADLLGDGEEYQVLKVKTPEGLVVEVYGQEKIGDMSLPKLLASTLMPDKRDGYFTYNGIVTNLAIDSVNNSSQKQILVTSYDENMVARINVYQFDKATKNLKLVPLNDQE